MSLRAPADITYSTEENSAGREQECVSARCQNGDHETDTV